MVIFQSYVSHYQRVKPSIHCFPQHDPEVHGEKSRAEDKAEEVGSIAKADDRGLVNMMVNCGLYI